MSESALQEAFPIFLRAYREVRAVSDEEIAAIPFLSLGFWLYYLGFYTTHDQFLPLLYNPHLKARTNLIRQIMERYERISSDGF
jgi:Ser/Thr protein kinase RdoA (MazF antagonist)